MEVSDGDNDKDFTVRPDQYKSHSDTFQLTLKKDFFKDPRIVAVATRCDISPSAQYALLSAIIEVRNDL